MNMYDIPKGNIQIVDDVPENLDVLSALLIKKGFDVRIAMNGKLALQSIHAHKPDLILLDIMMPGMSGFDVCERLKADERTRDIPVIFISAFDNTFDKVKSFMLGGVDYITKPFQAEEVLARVTAHIKLRNMQKRLEDQNLQLIDEIDERKRAEEKLKKLSNAVEQSASSIVITDIDGSIEYVNPAFCKTTGYSYKEAIGKNPRILKSGKHSPEFYHKMWKILDNGSVWKGEIINKRKNGKLYWEHVTISPVKNRGGDTTHYVTVKDDITWRKKAEAEKIRLLEEARKARTEAEKANRAKSEFLANMSHDIRTPMNAILGFTELLADQITDSTQKAWIKAVQAGGKSLLTLINDILDLSKIESGKFEINLEPVNIRDLADELARIFQVQIEQKALGFIVEIAPDVPRGLMLDETRLRQVLFNLIGNAVKFTDQGEIRLTVTTGVPPAAKGRYDILITVADTGIGIPADDQQLIFDPFRQRNGQKFGKYGGTGLGLTISLRLVKAMNGGMTLQSVPGQGSAFKITLRDIAVTDTIAKPKNKSTECFEDKTFANATILVADDVDTNRNLIKAFFDDMTDIDIIEAENGAEAVSLTEQRQPDIILMDIKMPVMDGYQAIKRIKAIEHLKSVPIIAVTASAMKQEDKKIKLAGFDAYITKPLRISDLFYQLARFLPCFEQKNQTEEKSPASEPVEITPETQAKLPEIIFQLENDFMSEWETIRKTEIFDDMAEFAIRIRDFAESHSLAMLMKFGCDLIVHVENFDIDNIDATLDAYPELLQKLKRLKISDEDRR
ncbi:response regulator [Desulfococcaceae bacterium HSG9]|nr:response regulator [Desulfococcaceae bacterium HSG9]